MPIVAFCALADLALISAGVAGLAAVLGAAPMLTLALTIGGTLSGCGTAWALCARISSAVSADGGSTRYRYEAPSLSGCLHFSQSSCLSGQRFC